MMPAGATWNEQISRQGWKEKHMTQGAGRASKYLHSGTEAASCVEYLHQDAKVARGSITAACAKRNK